MRNTPTVLHPLTIHYHTHADWGMFLAKTALCGATRDIHNLVVHIHSAITPNPGLGDTQCEACLLLSLDSSP